MNHDWRIALLRLVFPDINHDKYEGAEEKLYSLEMASTIGSSISENLRLRDSIQLFGCVIWQHRLIVTTNFWKYIIKIP